jgi:hypothetical protein
MLAAARSVRLPSYSTQRVPAGGTPAAQTGESQLSGAVRCSEQCHHGDTPTEVAFKTISADDCLLGCDAV